MFRTLPVSMVVFPRGWVMVYVSGVVGWWSRSWRQFPNSYFHRCGMEFFFAEFKTTRVMPRSRAFTVGGSDGGGTHLELSAWSEACARCDRRRSRRRLPSPSPVAPWPRCRRCTFRRGPPTPRTPETVGKFHGLEDRIPGEDRAELVGRSTVQLT